MTKKKKKLTKKVTKRERKSDKVTEGGSDKVTM